MNTEKLTDLDVALAQLRAAMLMHYGGALLEATTVEEKQEAFISLISSGIEIMASAITSRRPHDEVLQVTIEKFPAMLIDAVNAKIEIMAKIEASIEREGATVQ